MRTVRTSALVDLGHGMTVTILTDADSGDPLGVYWCHPDCPAGKNPANWIPVDGDPWQAQLHHFWHLVSVEPLTLEPSLLCTVCKVHGYIREGRWIPA